MKKNLLLLPVLAALLLLTGCVSGERLARNTPFASGNNSFDRNGVNLFPLYYREGGKCSILFPLIDIDDRGFAVRPFYHRDGKAHGILWPLCAFDDREFWVGPFFWKGKENFGCLLPFFCKAGDVLWVGNVYMIKDQTFLVFPIYGQGRGAIYFLNFLYHYDKDKKEFFFFPLAYYENKKYEKGFCTDTLYSPIVSFKRYNDELNMLNIMLLYHYSGGNHRFFYPLAGMKFDDYPKRAWIWPLFKYASWGYTEPPFFLFNCTSNSFKVLESLLLEFSYKDISSYSLDIFPFGLLWKFKLEDGEHYCSLLATLLWYSRHSPEMFDYQVLRGLLFRNSKDTDSHRVSLLYKFFTYHRFKDDVKWEIFPFVKIMETAKGKSWSFCWRLLEKHDGGGHIFFIPYGKDSGK